MQKLLFFLNTMRYICLGDRFLPEFIFLLFLKKGAATGMQNLCGGFFIHKGEMLYTEKKFFGFQKFFRLYLPQQGEKIGSSGVGQRVHLSAGAAADGLFFHAYQSLLLKLPEQRINPVMIGLVALQALHQLIPVLRPLIQVGQDHQLQHRHPLLYM